VEQAARREAQEETALEVTLMALLGVYSDPKRDPRGHTVSVVYLCAARGAPRAQDDAAAVGVSVRIVCRRIWPRSSPDPGDYLVPTGRGKLHRCTFRISARRAAV